MPKFIRNISSRFFPAHFAAARALPKTVEMDEVPHEYLDLVQHVVDPEPETPPTPLRPARRR